MSYDSAPKLHWFEGFYRTGSFIFGGGQVMDRTLTQQGPGLYGAQPFKRSHFSSVIGIA